MSSGRKRSHKLKLDGDANGKHTGRAKSRQQLTVSAPKNDDLEGSSRDGFDVSASNTGGKQTLPAPAQNRFTSQNSGMKSQRKSQHPEQVDMNANTGDLDEPHDYDNSEQSTITGTELNASKVIYVESNVKDINFDDSDFLAHRTHSFNASTPCLRKSQRAKRRMKWTDDFICEKAVCTKSKRPRLSAAEELLDSTLETSDQQTDDSILTLNEPVSQSPVVKRAKSFHRKKPSVLSDHKDLKASYQPEPRDNLSVSPIVNDSSLVEEKECEVICQTKRRRSQKASAKEEHLPLDETSKPHSEENSKEFPCCHCGEVKKNSATLRIHMAAKHHRIWTVACPEGKLDEYGSFKVTKSIRCLKCDKLCHTFSLYKSHIKWCGREEERGDCEVCGKNVRLMSYDAHVRYMHRRKDDANDVQAEEAAGETVDLPPAEISSNMGRSVRRAAVKARSKLLELTTDMVSSSSSTSHSKPQYICPNGTFPADFMKKLQGEMKKVSKLTCCYQGCSSEHSEVTELVAHLFICSQKPAFVSKREEFTCLGCGDSFHLEEEVLRHVTQHEWTTPRGLSSSESEASAFSSSDESSDDGDDDESDDCESEDGTSNESDLSQGATHSVKKKSKTGLLPMASFLQQHCWSNLFPNWKAKQFLYTALPALEESRYLPQNLDVSVKIQTSETEFSPTVKLGLFETYFYKESYNINVGGPIWAMAWSPVPPDDQVVQYLAIYTHRMADETHLVNECSSETAVIQLWRFHLQDHKALESEIPEIIGGLLLDCGPIWEMKWCPTGTWDKDPPAGDSEDLSRIGLLAVASQSGNVHILSVPKCFSVKGKEQQVKKFYRAMPVATLKRRGRDEICPCLCLDWHWKEKCGMLVAGFADGTTSLWDLYITSPLLRLKDEDGRDQLFPFQSIRSHVWPVKGVAFCQSRLNLLVTCSADRMVKLWDLTEPECPLATYHNTLNTGVIWPVNSKDTFTCAGDDCYLCEHNGTILCSYSNNKLLTRPLTVHNASVWGMSYNCWMHFLVSCDSVGLVLGVPWISPNHKSISDARQVLFLVEMLDETAETADCQMPLPLVDEIQSAENEARSTSSKGCHQVSEAARHSNGDACQCSCHSNQTDQFSRNSKCYLMAECKHCQSRRCLLFKDFSTKWKFSNTPIFYAKQLPVDNIHNSLSCSLNRIAWNNNYGCHKWLAVGGHAGILRAKFIEEIEQSQSKSKRKFRKK